MGRRGGFALVLVLAVLALCALMVTGLARSSLQEALDAVRREEELRCRWALRSLERAVLHRGEEILAGLETAREGERPVPAPAVWRAGIVLAGSEFDITLGDENAKINVNEALSLSSKDRAVPVIQELASGSVRLRMKAFEASSSKRGTLRSWGQLFDLAGLGSDQEAASQVAAATGKLTCWGDGRLNIRRASDESLQALCRLATDRSLPRRLLSLRKQKPNWSVSQLMQALRLPLRERGELLSVLTDRSRCHSLWIRELSQRRERYTLFVRDVGEDGMNEAIVFRW